MLVLLVLLTPMATAFACVLAAARPRLQLFLSWMGLAGLLACAVALLRQVDNDGALLIVRESFAQGRAVWGAVALGVGVLTLYSMAKIWMETFWKPHPDPAWQPAAARLAPVYVVATLLAALALGVGVYPQPFIAFANDAAQTLA